MAKGNIGNVMKVILIAILLFSTIAIIGAGCQKNITGESTIQKQQEQQIIQQPSILFSDDFSSYNMGATPNKWQTVMKDSLTATTKGMTQASGQYGAVLELRGKLLETGSSDWKDYTINMNFKISNAGNHIGPEVIFRKSGENYYLFSTYIKPTGTDFFVYKILEENKYELKRKAGKKIDDDLWHRLQIIVQGNEIRVNIDDSEIMSLTDDSLQQGNIALQSDPLSVIYFDDIIVIGTKI
ncbi:MAG: family 16 glycoside hydrolase [Candidatus Pacearchaeota archaeon]